jgi:pyruvate dehydrogenase E1 component beta subunit
MARDPRVVILGQDVGRFGGAYREFAGLHARFGDERVRDMPVAEASMVGVGVGAAAAGLRPLVSITYMDFVMLGLDPLVNYGAKLRYKTGGQLTAPSSSSARPARRARASRTRSRSSRGSPASRAQGRRPVDAGGRVRAHGRRARRRRSGRLRRSQAPVPDRGRARRRARAGADRAGDRAPPGRDVTVAPIRTCAASPTRPPTGSPRTASRARSSTCGRCGRSTVATVAASVARTGALVTLEEGQLAVRDRHRGGIPRSRGGR